MTPQTNLTPQTTLTIRLLSVTQTQTQVKRLTKQDIPKNPACSPPYSVDAPCDLDRTAHPLDIGSFSFCGFIAGAVGATATINSHREGGVASRRSHRPDF